MLSFGKPTLERMFRPLGLIFTGILVVALLVLGGSVPRASAATTGTITGTVTLPAGIPSSELKGIRVAAMPISSGTYSGVYVDPSTGNYIIDDLEPGSYRIQFQSANYWDSEAGQNREGPNVIAEYYNNTTDFGSAAPVTVAAGATTANINAALEAGGTINGVVALPNGAPAVWLRGIQVYVTPTSGMGGFIAPINVNPTTGAYSVRGLPAGDYHVRFSATSYWDENAPGGFAPAPNVVPEYFDNATSSMTATTVTVTAAGTTNGINGALELGGTITGRVVLESGIPASAYQGIHVYAGAIAGIGSGGSGFVDPATGDYTISGLPAGDYRVNFSVSSYWDPDTNQMVPAPSVIPEYYNDTRDYNAANPVSVSAGGTTANINATLAKGGTISGTITLPPGIPSDAMRGILVSVIGADGPWGGSVMSSVDPTTGDYSVTGLPAGRYVLQFGAISYWDENAHASITPNVIAEYYNDVSTFEDATILELSQGGTLSDKNVTLAKGAIASGTISLPAGTSYASLSLVSASTFEPAATYAEVNPGTGAFSLERLLPGDYYVVASTSSPAGDGGFTYGAQYARRQSPSTAYKITVPSAGVSGLNLVASPLDATISGTLTASGFAGNASSDTYLADAVVYQKLDTGWAELPYGTRESTQAVGAKSYSIPGLAAGTYTVGFEKSQTPYSGATSVNEQWWQNKSSLVNADSIVLSGGQTKSGVNGTVTPKTTTPPTGFSDVSGTPGSPTYSAFATEIAWMASQGISTGYDVPGGKEYRPFGQVTRDAMAAFLYRAAGSPAFTAPAVSPFTDVTPTSPFYKEITWMASQNISTGWDIGGGEKEFRPFANITRDAMAAFLYRYAHLN